MGNRERLLTLVLGAVLVALGMFWTSAASADQIITNPSFTDARGDYNTSRPGTLVEARYGPFTVNANSQVHNAIDFSAPAPCSNCYITDIVPNLIYDGDPNNPTGTTANLNNGAMMHHFVLINPARQDAVCPSGLQGQLGERFFASGNERTHMHLPRPFGYYNPAGQNTWTLIYHLVNKAAVQKKLSIQVFYRYRTDPPNVTEAKPLWLDIDGCGDSEYTIPTGYSDTTVDWTSNVSGRMVAISGHLHDVDITSANPCDTHCPAEGGGIAVSAELVGGASNYYGPVPPDNPPPASLTGTTLCRSEGYYGTTFGGTQWKGHLDTMSECGIQSDIPAGAQAEAYPAGGAYPTQGLPIQSGNVIRLHSEYQNGTGSPQTDVMGIMMAWYTPPDPGFPRPKGATPTRVALVPAYNQCTSPNRTHGAPLSNGSCAPPVASSSWLTMGSPDANGAPANGSGTVTVKALTSDVQLSLNATDVRCKPGETACGSANAASGADYTGQLQAQIPLRIIDRNSGPDLTGVTQDTTYSFTSPCTSTASTSAGSTCAVTTTANTLAPGAVSAGQRAIWQLGKIDVYDGGSDGVVSTGPNTRYMTQGYFVP